MRVLYPSHKESGSIDTPPFRDNEGFCHVTFTAAGTFVKAFSLFDLERCVKSAAVRLRHLVPSIACKVAKLPTNEYQLTYAVPKSLDDAVTWADDIVSFTECARTRFENHERIARDRWWTADAGNYTPEFYITPASASSESSSSWTFA